MNLRALLPLILLLLGACANTNLAPPAELVEFEETANIERVWRAGIGDLGEDLRLGLVPASDGENIYVADHDGSVYAFRLSDGDELWQHDTSEFRLWGDSPALKFSAGPAVADGRVVAGTIDGEILALDASTGEKLWQADLAAELLTQPLIAGGLVILPTTDGRVLALDAASGERRWETLRETPVLTIRGLAAPISDGRQIYLGFDNGKVAALALRDGRMIWEAAVALPGGGTELDEIVDVDGELAMFGQELYATSYNGDIAALALESGEVLWRREFSSVTAPSVAWGNVFASSVDSTVRAYDRLSGATVWSQEQLFRRDLTGPVVFGSLLVVGDFEGYLHFLDLGSGEMVARVSHPGEPLRARPLVVNDLLVVLSEDGGLAVYRRSDKASGGE